MANKLTPEEAEVIVEWPDGKVTEGRMLAIDPAKFGLATDEWLSGPLLDHVRARGLSEAEREAMCAQVAEADPEFRACVNRTSAPQAPGIPRVVVRAVRGWAGNHQVAWLSRDEIVRRMTSLSRELAAASSRLRVAATTEERGYLAASLDIYAAQLQAEAGHMRELSAEDFGGLPLTGYRPPAE